MTDERELKTWQRIRRYAVPGRMIEECTERRLAGDWRGACAAAGIDIILDLAAIAGAHGREAADRIEADLAVLAPDLLRWHLPRALGGRSTLATDKVCLLSTAAGRLDPELPVLAVRMPAAVDGSQRLRLEAAQPEPTGYRVSDLPPYQWSAAHAHLLRDAFTGPDWPAPGLPADVDLVAAAWRAAGFELDRSAEGTKPWLREALRALPEQPIHLAGLLAEAVRVADRYGAERLVIHQTILRSIELDLSDRTRPRAEPHAYPETVTGPAVEHWLPDLDLLRAGLVEPAELHPLVRAALCPSLPAGGPPPELPLPLPFSVRVRCQGVWHRLEHRDGALHPVAHTADEVRREQTLRGLGGPVAGCFAAQQAWRTGSGRLPRALRAHRQELLERIRHGGGPALLALLDAGMDPLVRDARGGTLLHHLRAAEAPGVLARLLAAGLAIDTIDMRGRTPMHVAVGDGGSPALVGALLSAGADPHATDTQRGVSVLDLSDWKSRDDDYWYEDEHDDDEEDTRPDTDVTLVNRLLHEWTSRDRG